MLVYYSVKKKKNVINKLQKCKTDNITLAKH